jgi:hypothetical protein
MHSTDKDNQMLQNAAYVPEKKASTIQREAFFLDFAKIIRQRFPHLILMVTGGFRTRGAMETAVQSGACDLIGLARPAAAVPRLPKEVLLNDKVEDSEAQIWLKPIALPVIAKWLPLKNLSAGNETVIFHTSTLIFLLKSFCMRDADVSSAEILQQADSTHGPRTGADFALLKFE